MADKPSTSDLLALTSEIVAAHVANNPLAAEELPMLIRQVYASLATVDGGATAAPERPDPAVAVRKSIMPDYIVCLEDGKKLKMLKRYLRTRYNMTPEQYRERWGLSADYPMVAPNYAAQRSALAKKIGLGTKPRKRRRG